MKQIIGCALLVPVLGPDGRPTDFAVDYVSEYVASIFGRSREWALRARASEMTAPAMWKSTLAILSDVWKDGACREIPGDPKRTRPPVVGELRAVACRIAEHVVLVFDDLTPDRRLIVGRKLNELEQRVILDALPDIAWVKSPDFRYAAVNTGFESHAGRRSFEIAGLTDMDLYPAEVARENMSTDLEVQERRSALRKVQRLPDPATSVWRWFDTVKAPLIDGDGAVVGTLGMARDISIFIEQERTLQGLIANLPGLFYRRRNNHAWTALLMAGLCEEITGYACDTLVGESAPSWADLVHPEDRDTVRASVQEACENRSAFSLEYRIVAHDGAEKWVAEYGSPVRDGKGEVAILEGFVLDITERKRQQAEFEYRANHDDLTGLANRFRLLGWLEKGLAAARRRNRSIGVLFANLDNFRVVSDSYGHEAGDELLRQVARDLRTIDIDTGAGCVARFGGDEFVIAAEFDGTPEALPALAERMRASIRRPKLVRGESFVLSASIGCAVFPTDAQDVDKLVTNASAAAFKAKGMGRDCVYHYDRTLTAEQMEHISIETGLRQALADDALVLHFQPKISLADGRITGVEALIRWPRPDGEMLLPSRFVPVAERSALIVELGDWALEKACSAARAMAAATGRSCPVAVNIAARQFRDPDLVDRVAAILERAGLAPETLEFEITESTLMHDLTQAAETMLRLKALGVRIAIDDFGTGYSSMTYLRRFPLDSLKLDISFVRDIDTSPSAAAVAKGIIELGKSLGLTTVAEGVETDSHAAFLRGCGCDLAQGWLFHTPQPLAALLPLLTTSR